MNSSENQINSNSSGKPLNLSTVPVLGNPFELPLVPEIENIGWKNGIGKNINFPVFIVCPNDEDETKMTSYKAQLRNLLVNGEISVNFESDKLFKYSNKLIFFNEEVADLKCEELNGIIAEPTVEELIQEERTLTRSFGTSTEGIGHGLLEAEFIESGGETISKKKKKKKKSKRRRRHKHKKSRKRKRRQREYSDSEEEKRERKRRKTSKKTMKKIRKRKVIKLPVETRTIDNPESKCWTGIGSVKNEIGKLIGTSPEYTHFICRELFPSQIRFTSGMVRQTIEGLGSNGKWGGLIGQYFAPNAKNTLLNNTGFNRVLRRELQPGTTNRYFYWLEDKNYYPNLFSMAQKNNCL